MITDEQLSWVALQQTNGIGPKTFDQVISYLDSMKMALYAFWQLSEKSYFELELPTHLIKAIVEQKSQFDFDKQRKQFEQKDIKILLKNDQLYPTLLKQIPDAPAVLYVLGELKETFALPIAVVGTRRITGYGKMVTRLLVKQLVEHQCEIISGFMYGVDSVAHQSALDCSGYTVGVLGYGFDHCYPQSHSRLRENVLKGGGALLSEYHPSQIPIPGLFPQRNRLVAGLSKGVVVTEAAAESGSKITAKCAVEYGRDVFAVSGPITSKFATGTKDLINLGAKLVIDANDILEEYQTFSNQNRATMNIEQLVEKVTHPIGKEVLGLLLQQPLSADDIQLELCCDAHQLLQALGELEMIGVVTNQLGQYTLNFK